MATVYLNGEFIAKEQATLSIFDRGFLFGDAVYEVIPVFGNHLFRLQQHLKRLQASLDAINIKLTIAYDVWHELLTRLLHANPAAEQSIYIQISRGNQFKRQHQYPDDISPTIVAFCQPLQSKSLEQLTLGAKAITREDIRWQWCYIKSNNLLANLLMIQQARRQQAIDAILINGDHVIEACSSNVFMVKNKRIYTPVQEQRMLGGITRELVLELLKKHHIAVIEKTIHIDELTQADEIWLTSSSKEIMPIIELDQSPVGDGKPGPIWHQAINYYLDYKKTLSDTHKVK